MKLSKVTIILSLRSSLFIFTFLSIAFIYNQSLNELMMWWSVICSICNFVTIILLFWLTRSLKTTYRNLIHYQKGYTQVKLIIYGIIIILTIGISGMFLAGFIVYRELPYFATSLVHPIPIGLAILNVIILPITTTLAEDGLYLGFGVNMIKNKWIAVIIPAFFYALQHCFIPLYWNIDYIMYRFLSFLPLTMLLGFWYQKKRNPTPIMIGHFVINLATVIQILLMSIYPEIYISFL